MTSFLSPSLGGGFGGQNAPSTDTAALQAINSQQQTYVNKDFVKNIAWLNNSVDTLSQWDQKLQAGVDKANSDVIQQIEGIWSDLFVLFAGFSPTGINIGDAKFVLQGLGALFGINPGTPFPMNLFDAAMHMFMTYVVPTTQFTDVIFTAIEAWAEDLGLSPEFIQSIQDLSTALNGLTSSASDLFSAVQKLVDAFGPDLTPITDLLNSLINLFDLIDFNALKPVIRMLADLGVPFINALTAIVNGVNSFLTPLGIISGAQVKQLGTNFLPPVSGATNAWTVGSNDTAAFVYDSVNDAFETQGTAVAKQVVTQQIYQANPGAVMVFNGQAKWTGVPTGVVNAGVIVEWTLLNVVAQTVKITLPVGHSLDQATFVPLATTTLTVPANVDGVRVGAFVDSPVTAGTVWVKGITAQLQGTVDQSLVTGLPAALASLLPLNVFNSFVGGTADTTNIPAFLGSLLTGTSPLNALNLTNIETFVDDLLTPTTWFHNVETALGSPGLSLGTVDPQSMWNTIISDFLNPSGLLTGMNWGQLAQELFGVGGVANTPTAFGSVASDFMSLLGNPTGLGSGSFDPITAGQNLLQTVLTPAGALTSWTQLPPHLLGMLGPGASADGGGLQNMLPDPGFDDPNTLNGQGLWTHDSTVGRTVTSSVVGSAKTIAGSVLRQLIGVPITTAPDQISDFGAHLRWTGLTAAAGQAIRLCANAYDVNDNPIVDSGRVLMSIAAPTTNSTSYLGEPAVQPPPPASDSQGWVYLSGTYKAPAGTKYVRLCVEILSNVTAGTVWVDDCLQLLHGIIDVLHFGNWGNLQELIPANVVTGFQGIEDMLQTLIHTFDGLGSALNFGTDLTNVTPTQLFGLAQSTANNALLALQHAIDSINILGRRSNKPALNGLNPTSQSTFHILAGTAINSNMTSIPAGTSLMMTSYVAQEDSMKGFFEFLATGNGGANVFTNVFKIDPATNNKNKVWGSADISNLLPANGVLGYCRVPIPGGQQPSMVGGEQYVLEIVNAGTTALSVHTKATGAPNHPTEAIKNFGATRTLSTTGGNSPASLADSQLTYSGTLPYINLGVLAVPANYVVPIQQKFTNAGAGQVFTLPSWITDGDVVDMVGIGGGGSGMSEWDAGIMAGGLGGTWAGMRMVYASDPNGTGLPIIPRGTTQIIVNVGLPGPQCNGYWQNGNPGTATTFVVGGTTVLTCPFGQGGSGSVGLSNGTGSGPNPKNFVWQGDTYFGGSDVGINAPGSAPGGGGGGATWYEFGGVGAKGYAEIHVSRPGGT